MNNWRRLFSGCGGADGGPRGTCRQNLGADGGAWALETYDGPGTGHGDTILNECGTVCNMIMNILIRNGTFPLYIDR